MRYWREREISDRLIAERTNRKELRNRELPAAVGFEWVTEPEDYDDN